MHTQFPRLYIQPNQSGDHLFYKLDLENNSKDIVKWQNILLMSIYWHKCLNYYKYTYQTSSTLVLSLFITYFFPSFSISGKMPYHGKLLYVTTFFSSVLCTRYDMNCCAEFNSFQNWEMKHFLIFPHINPYLQGEEQHPVDILHHVLWLI